LDNIDKEIISFLKEGSSISTKIRQYLRNIKHFELTLRTIENRVSKLNEDGIVKISKGRNNIIDLSDDFKKLS
jgi:DNA-binding Lrp family transcriptional regulator